MAVVKEIRDGPCVITVHDDCYVARSQEDIEQTVKNVSAIIHNAAREQVDKSAS